MQSFTAGLLGSLVGILGRLHSVRGGSLSQSRPVSTIVFTDVGALVLIGFVSLLGFAESRSSKRRVW